MPERFSIDIREVVDFLGLQQEPHERDAVSFNVKCPFCNDRKYHMNINVAKGAYSCVLCSKGTKGQGALDLYGRVAHGVRCVKGQNSKELYRQLCEDLRKGPPAYVRRKAKTTLPPIKTISRAPDEVVNETYEKLLAIKHLALTEAHKNNLIARGLSEQTIVRNQYRSLGQNYDWLQQYPEAHKRFLENRDFAAKDKILRRKKPQELEAGFAIAEILLSCGCQLSGVPGFFKLGGHWCFNVEPGLLIPTRNFKKRPVALQVRKDDCEKRKGKKFLRYMTISSKGLPQGVTERISRPHFPLGNVELGPDAKVYLTEGPLKADVATELLGPENHTFFIALQGVNNVRELKSIFKMLSSVGVKTVENAFDMDKCCNIHVAQSGQAIRKTAQSYGISLQVLSWDREYAEVKREELGLLCSQHDLFIPTTLNPFTDVARMAQLLDEHDILHSRTLNPDGTEEKHFWRDETKGIDDYLLFLKKQGSTTKGLTAM